MWTSRYRPVERETTSVTAPWAACGDCPQVAAEIPQISSTVPHISNGSGVRSGACPSVKGTCMRGVTQRSCAYGGLAAAVGVDRAGLVPLLAMGSAQALPDKADLSITKLVKPVHTITPVGRSSPASRDTRAKGHYDFTPAGLHVWTEASACNDPKPGGGTWCANKAAEYFAHSGPMPELLPRLSGPARSRRPRHPDRFRRRRDRRQRERLQHPGRRARLRQATGG